MRGITLNASQTNMRNIILEVLPLSFDVSYELVDNKLTFVVYGSPDSENLQRPLLAKINTAQGTKEVKGFLVSFVYANEVEQDTILKSLKKQLDYPVYED